MKNNNNFHDYILNNCKVGRTSNTFKSFVICTLLLLANMAMAQNIITIDNNPESTTTFQTIQAAHDNATAGDIIYVQPSGTSYGNLQIIKPITIVGRSHSEQGKVSTLGAITVRASNVNITGLSFSSLGYTGADSSNPEPFTGLNVLDCKFSSMTLGAFGAGILADEINIRGNLIASQIQIYPDTTNVLISNNILTSASPIVSYQNTSLIISNNIFRYNSTPITISNASTNGTLSLFNNMFIFTGASNSAVSLSQNSFNISNNLTYNVRGFSVTINATNGAILTENNTLSNTNPQFTNIDISVGASFAGNSTYNPAARIEDNLTLQAGSPALTGGTGDSEIGLYSNGFLYKLLGNPKGIPTLDVLSYDGSVPKNGNINVTINAKAH